MRNNAQKHLHRSKLGHGGVGTYTFEHSAMYMERFYGGAKVNALACLSSDVVEEGDESNVPSSGNKFQLETGLLFLPYFMV